MHKGIASSFVLLTGITSSLCTKVSHLPCSQRNHSSFLVHKGIASSFVLRTGITIFSLFTKASSLPSLFSKASPLLSLFTKESLFLRFAQRNHLFLVNELASSFVLLKGTISSFLVLKGIVCPCAQALGSSHGARRCQSEVFTQSSASSCFILSTITFLLHSPTSPATMNSSSSA